MGGFGAMKKQLFLDTMYDYLNVYIIHDRGLSQNTRNTYIDAFKLLFDYFYDVHNLKSDEIKFNDLNYEMITGYLNWLEEVRKCSINTRNQRLAALKSFSDYSQIKSIEASLSFRREIIKIHKKKFETKEKSYFTKEEIKALLEANSNTKIGKRNKMLIAFMYSSGARAQEICDLKVKDMQFGKTATYVTLHGKGKKSRKITIPTKISLLLKNHLIAYKIGNDSDAYVFSSQTHEYMSVSCIEEIYKKLINIAKSNNPLLFNKSYSPHSMRHTTATHMVEAGIPLLVIKNFMGHCSIQTTQVYAKVTQENLNKQTELWNKTWLSETNKPENKDDRIENIPAFLR